MRALKIFSKYYYVNRIYSTVPYECKKQLNIAHTYLPFSQDGSGGNFYYNFDLHAFIGVKGRPRLGANSIHDNINGKLRFIIILA